MKKLLIALALLTAGLSASGQVYQKMGLYGYEFLRVRLDSALYIPVRDTAFTPDTLGAITAQPDDSALYFYDGHAWQGFVGAKLLGEANGVATLDANGKLNNDQVPAIAITNTYVVGDMASMLALDADTGDVAIRSDSSITFILQNTPATEYNNWQQLLSPGAPVTSVNGKTGAVTLTPSDIGAADDDSVVHKAGAEFISGSKSFTGTVSMEKLNISGNGDDSYMSFNTPTDAAYSGSPSATTYGINTSSNPWWYRPGMTNPDIFTFSAEDGHNYTFPDADGTITLSSDITLSNVLSGGNTALNSIALGSTSSGVAYSYSLNRAFNGLLFTGSVVISGNNGYNGIKIRSSNGTASAALHISADGKLGFTDNDNIPAAAQPVWWGGNDGAGSGLDADKLDGIEATEFTLQKITDNGSTTTNPITAPQFKVSALNTAPSSSTDTGTAGEVRVTSVGIFICIATNSWIKCTGSTF